MSLKSAAQLALIGVSLLTILVVADFIRNLLAVLQGLLPPMTLLASIVFVLASLSMVVFLYVFHKSQS